MPSSGGDGGESAAGRARLAVVVRTPAHDSAVEAQAARVIPARRHSRVGRSRRLLFFFRLRVFGGFLESDTTCLGADELRCMPAIVAGYPGQRVVQPLELLAEHCSETAHDVAHQGSAGARGFRPLLLFLGPIAVPRPGADDAIRADHAGQRHRAVQIRQRRLVRGHQDRLVARAIGRRVLSTRRCLDGARVGAAGRDQRLGADQASGMPAVRARQPGQSVTGHLGIGHRRCAAHDEPVRSGRLEAGELVCRHRFVTWPCEHHALGAQHACERHGAVQIGLRRGVGCHHYRRIAGTVSLGVARRRQHRLLAMCSRGTRNGEHRSRQNERAPCCCGSPPMLRAGLGEDAGVRWTPSAEVHLANLRIE